MSVDGGVTLGMVLLHEAATSDLDVGKRKSEYNYLSFYRELLDAIKISDTIFNKSAFTLWGFYCEYQLIF